MTEFKEKILRSVDPRRPIREIKALVGEYETTSPPHTLNGFVGWCERRVEYHLKVEKEMSRKRAERKHR